jgi:hypothetical protein
LRLTDHEELSSETVRRRLAENHLKPWRKDMWCIPKVDGEYVARMEDVLELMPRRPIPKDLWSASTRARPNSSARCASPLVEIEIGVLRSQCLDRRTTDSMKPASMKAHLWNWNYVCGFLV